MKLKFLISIFFLITFFSNCTTYTSTIIKNHDYSSFDLSFKWSYHNNTFDLTGINNFWTELFNLQIKLTPVDNNMKPLENGIKKYVGFIEMDETFHYVFHFTSKKIKFIQLDYFYNYSGYNSSGNILNYYTVFFNVSH